MRNVNIDGRTLTGLSRQAIRRMVARWLSACAIAATVGGGLFVVGQQLGLPTSPAASPASAAMSSYPLGIDLPAGADAATLPTGLTDYLRPDR